MATGLDFVKVTRDVKHDANDACLARVQKVSLMQ